MSAFPSGAAEPATLTAPTARLESSADRRVAAVVQPGGGHVASAFGNDILFKLTAEQTAGALSIGLATVPAGTGGPPLHVHDGEDELFIIVEGRYRVYADGEWTEAGPGSVVYLPRGVAHTFHTADGEAGRHWVLTTSGDFERFYTRCADLFAVPGPPDGAKLAAIGAEHGMRVLRPTNGGAAPQASAAAE